MPGAPLDAGDVAHMLGERIEALAPQLLPGGRRDGRLWRAGSLLGEAGQSLAVEIRGSKRGRWWEFNGGFGGDALDLVAQCCCGGDLGRALEWARNWLGLGRLDETELARQRQRLAKAAAQQQQNAATDERQRRADARRIWLAGAPLRRGDIVWRYLAGRGIELDRLPRLPGSLRCHPGLWHAKSGRYWPAMVAAIAGVDPHGKPVHAATHRTWLEVRQDGRVTKAPLGADAKMSLGPFRAVGGAVHLTRGDGNHAWGNAIPGAWAAFSEGIEDGLSFACERPDLRVAACATSLAYLANVALPPECGGVVVIRQNDPAGSDADHACARGIAGLRRRGLAVRQVLPPPDYKDFNDLIQALAG